ncbi:protein zer-1 homolog [Ixodes scapularis]
MKRNTSRKVQPWATSRNSETPPKSPPLLTNPRHLSKTAFTDKPELLRNMMGLLGNVAEVKELRPRLMKDDYLQVFSDLLDSTSDGIEVSYNAAGILAHLVSDGAEQWERHGIRAVRRDQVLARMGRAIERWALLAKRNINYRSFEPILRLLGVRHTPQAQHWAVWALANLTQVYPDKYCPLVQEEGGLVLLQELLDSDTPYERIKDLARIIVDQCARTALHAGARNADCSSLLSGPPGRAALADPFCCDRSWLRRSVATPWERLRALVLRASLQLPRVVCEEQFWRF